MTAKQIKTIEWLKQVAERSFNEWEYRKENFEFSTEVSESDCTKLVFLSIRAKAKAKTGLLFLDNKTLHVCIGPSGGIRAAEYIGDKRSKSKTAYYVRRGIITMA